MISLFQRLGAGENAFREVEVLLHLTEFLAEGADLLFQRLQTGFLPVH